MKKLLLSLLFLNLFIVPVYGETVSSSNETISLNYEVAPTYKVTLPVTVDVTENTTQFVFSVSGDIYYDSYLEVLFDETTIITNGKNQVTVYVTQDKTDFHYSELNSDDIHSTITIIHSSLSAGEWTSELNILIALKGEN